MDIDWEPLDPETVRLLDIAEAEVMKETRKELEELEAWRSRSMAEARNIWIG